MQKDLDLQEIGKRLRMIDRFIVAILGQRMDLGKLVEQYKRVHGQPIIRFEVENERLTGAQEWARDKGLDQNFIRALFYSIIAETCRIQINQLQTQPPTETLSVQKLKENATALTEAVAHLYDANYGKGSFATGLYREFEDKVIAREIVALKMMNNLGVAIDLGCATGRKTFQLAEIFSKSIGYDISPAMIDIARSKLIENPSENIDFKIADIDDGIPKPSGSVSFALMNLGTASHVLDARRFLAELKRILLPDGRFLLSFYNRGALLYNCWFLPWQPSLAANFNTAQHCLEVKFAGKTYQVPAKPYTVREIKGLLMKAGLKISQIVTYPTITPLLPNEFFEEESMQKQISEIDSKLTSLDTGAYIIVTGRKAV